MEERNNSFLADEKIGKLMRGYAIPCIISLLVGALYNIVDQIFIANASYLGSFGNAANESAYYTDFAVKSFRTYLCLIVLACINKAAFIFLQAMGKAAASTALSMIREIVFGVGLAMILPIFFGLDGVLYSMPIADFLTAIVSLAVIIFAYRELSSPEQKSEIQARL